MKRNIIRDDHPYKHLMVEYDPKNPDPLFTQAQINYIESRQAGLTERDIAKLDEIEWFIGHRHLKTLASFAIPGLRPSGLHEIRYFKRFDSQPYVEMNKQFFSYVPPDFPIDQVDRCFLQSIRLKDTEENCFYPISYNGNIPAWRKRMLDNADHFETTIGYFDHGRFVVSDGREVEFADMDVLGLEGRYIPLDF